MGGELKGGKIQSNDGKDLGDINKISQNYIKLVKGTIKKEKFWVPKYLADAFDGKVRWLLTGEEETVQNSNMGKNHPQRGSQNDFGSFKTSYGQNRTWDADKVSVTPERTIRDFH